MQLSAAATGSTSTIAATRPRVAGNVSGRRARAKLRNKIVVLRRLRRRQTQLLICTLQIAHLGVGQEVQNGAAVGVLIFHDVAGRVLHRVARVARLRGHVVAHALDAALGVAAALGSLHLHGVELLHQRGLLVGAGQFSGLETVVHVLVDTGKAVQQRGVRGIEAIAQPTVDEIHLALNVGKIGRQHIAVYHAAGIAAVVAPAVITPAKEGKQEQDDDDLSVITIPSKTAVAAGVSGCHGHCQHGSAVRRKRHRKTPFSFLLSNRGHDID